MAIHSGGAGIGLAGSYDWAGPRASRGSAPRTLREVTRATCDGMRVGFLRRPAPGIVCCRETLQREVVKSRHCILK